MVNMKNHQYDAVIVGARPAGAGMAAFLSQAGLRVLLADRVTFPKPTLSCPLYFANTLSLLKRIGVLEKVEALGAPQLRLYQTNMGDIRLRGRMMPYDGLDYAYQMRRERFDEVMFNHVAAMPNVAARLGFNVTGLVWENDRAVGVRGSHSGGPEEEIRADMVIGADGIFSTVAERVKAKKYKTVPARTCVYYAYYENVAPATSEPTATIYYSPQEHFTFVTANSESDLTVVSISLPVAHFAAAREQYETLHYEYAQKIPEMAERMKHAQRVTPVYGVSPRESFYRTPFGKGWVLVGDAGYYKDPLPGQGIHDALRSAELATQAFVEYRANGGTSRAWNDAFRKYHKTRDAETAAMYKLTDFYAQLDRDRTPAELDFFRAIAAQPEWSDRYVSMFNGVTSVKWFVGFPTPLRILVEWRWKQLKQKFTGVTQSGRTEPANRPTATDSR